MTEAGTLATPSLFTKASMVSMSPAPRRRAGRREAPGPWRRRPRSGRGARARRRRRRRCWRRRSWLGEDAGEVVDELRLRRLVDDRADRGEDGGELPGACWMPGSLSSARASASRRPRFSGAARISGAVTRALTLARRVTALCTTCSSGRSVTRLTSPSAEAARLGGVRGRGRQQRVGLGVAVEGGGGGVGHVGEVDEERLAEQAAGREPGAEAAVDLGGDEVEGLRRRRLLAVLADAEAGRHQRQRRLEDDGRRALADRRSRPAGRRPRRRGRRGTRSWRRAAGR